MTTELWRWSAERIVQGVCTKEISAVEVVSACLERLDETNAATGAFVQVAADAVDRAKEADAAVSRGEPLGPLHGVPIAFKITANQLGYETTHGVGAYAGALSTENDPQVQSLLMAGGIAIGRTNCPPFATRWTTESDYYGTTRNPWDKSVTPGGSSGGAAVAVATGVCPVAQGSDIGGSIRYPAVNCGVVGIRPTVGRVPAWNGPPGAAPALATQQYVANGPLTRTISDLRIALRAMETPDRRDPMAAPEGAVLAPLSARRVAVVTSVGSSGLAGPSDPAVDAALRQAGQWLSDAGWEVEEVELPVLAEAATLWWQLALTEFKVVGVVDDVHRVGEPGIRRFFDLMYEVYDDEFGEVEFADFLAGYARRALLRREVSVFMDEHPILLLPNSGEPAFPLGEDVVSVDRTRAIMAHQWPNMAVPVLGLPSLGIGVRREGGAPLGVHVTGRAFDEETVFTAGEVIEARSGITTPIDPEG